jgi:hypothetical protein
VGNVTPTHQGINRAGRASWRSRQQPNVTVTPLLRKCHTTVATVPVTRPTFTALVAADMYRRWASGRRRAYRRRTVAPYRRRGRKVRWRPRVRRSYRRSVPARRFKRRVLAISQTKKSDKMLGATSTGTIQPITLATGFNSVAYNLWSPPTREYDNQEVDPQDRNRSSIFFVGWKDVMYMEMTQAVIWRRIVFWSYKRYEFAQSVLNSDGNYFRRWEPYLNDIHPEVTEDILRGSDGIDYSERFSFDAQTDPKKIRVIYDRKRVFNPFANNPTVRNFKMWHPIRKKIVFDDPEEGDDMESNVWSVESPRSAGNVYVLDMFAHAVSQGPTAGPTTINAESTVYWRET